MISLISEYITYPERIPTQNTYTGCVRLLTFQSLEFLDELLIDGVVHNKGLHRVKEKDRAYDPIYCFLTLSGNVLDFNTLSTDWRFLMRHFKFSGRALLEIAVENKDILSLSAIDETYVGAVEAIVSEIRLEQLSGFHVSVDSIAGGDLYTTVTLNTALPLVWNGDIIL